MFRVLVLVTVLTACLADEEAQPTASSQVLIHDYNYLQNHRLQQGLERLRHDLNVPSNPHRHLEDPYRTNKPINRDNLGYRRDEIHNRRDKYDNRNKYDDRRDEIDNRRDKYDNRNNYDDRREETDNRRDKYDNRDKYDDRRDDKGRGRNDWQDHRKNFEKQWWTDKDKIEHVDDDQEIQGPVILRTIKSHEDHYTPDIARQNKIIKDVYSPDYAQPTWIIDYRYLKTGGRDYTRGPGGQIIILPKGIRTNEHKEFKDYDELIEHLRLQNLAERSKPQYFQPLGQEINQQRHDDKSDDDRRWYN